MGAGAGRGCALSGSLLSPSAKGGSSVLAEDLRVLRGLTLPQEFLKPPPTSRLALWLVF